MEVIMEIQFNHGRESLRKHIEKELTKEGFSIGGIGNDVVSFDRKLIFNSAFAYSVAMHAYYDNTRFIMDALK